MKGITIGKEETIDIGKLTPGIIETEIGDHQRAAELIAEMSRIDVETTIVTETVVTDLRNVTVTIEVPNLRQNRQIAYDQSLQESRKHQTTCRMMENFLTEFSTQITKRKRRPSWRLKTLRCLP